MAIDQREVEALPQSTQANRASHGPFIQNMFHRQGALEVRQGWGQIGQFDSTLGLSATDHGFQEVLGSSVMKTDFNHTQIITVLSNYAFTGNTATRGYWQTTYTVIIYDVTSRQVWEESLTRHTSEQDPRVTLPTTYRGVYETNAQQDFAAFPQATSARVWMTEYQDSMYFGNPAMGIWRYTPTDFAGRCNVQLNGIRTQGWAPTFGESAVVIPVSPAPGLTQAAAGYLDSGGFPVVASATVIDNRLCYASGRSIYFADPGFAGSIRGTNILQVPCEDAISCIIEYSGNLYVFTPRETWLYQPNVGDVVANGRLTKISSSVGCSSVYGAIRAGGDLVWMDGRGVYTMKGLFDISPLSGPIKNLFDDGVGVSNPMTSYLVNHGTINTNTSLAVDTLPQTFLYAKPEEVVFAYDPLFRQVIMAFPSTNSAWVYQEGAWFFWTWETVVNYNQIATQATTTIRGAWPLAIDGSVYGVAGTETYTPDDKTKTGGQTSAPENAASKSFYVLKAGVGGNVDRTVSTQEDNRKVAGYYEGAALDKLAAGYFRIGESWKAPKGYDFPTNGSGAPEGTYLYPVFFTAKDGRAAVDNFILTFLFDNTQWQPYFRDNSSSTELDLIIPPERAGGTGGWRFGAPILGQAGAVCIDSGTGTASRNGNIVYLQWNAADAVGSSGFDFTKMNATPGRETLLGYIPLRKKINTLNNTAMSMGFSLLEARVYFDFIGDIYDDFAVYAWHQAYTPNLHKADDTAQPIDWVIKTDQMGLDGQNSIKSRGMYIHLVDHGSAAPSSQIAPDWKFGTFNTLSSGDMNDYSGQVKDFGEGPANLGPFGSTEHAFTKVDIRNRITLVTGPQAGQIAPKVFDNVAAQWGSAFTNAGSVLVDNQAYDTRAISDHVRGETVSWMLYGHMRNPAERIVVDSIKATVKDVGQRRRRGR